ncbi:hypothetical protein [Salmonirosea aquatica]|uniref:Lipoprotein n=1 Tax=Salmonirosea aquatica TaxID=2654236 RepID=A0A7C9FC16_9BACT|nr:hypothetical protein [Cytophagaceae bacterium SJW1-29]
MKNLLIILALLLVGCNDSTNQMEPMEPEFTEPPEGLSFISAEYDGERFDFIENQNGVKSLGISFTNRSSDTVAAKLGTAVIGLGETLGDSLTKTQWTIMLHFTRQEWLLNQGNSTKLLKSGPYDFLFQDKSYHLTSSRGAVIEIVKWADDGSGLGNSTLTEQDSKTRSFTISKVYYDTLTNSQLLYPLIWIEGSFDGWMSGDKKIKGKFRIKTQPNL